MKNAAAEAVVSLTHDVRTATANGTAVDLAGTGDTKGFREAVVVVQTGTVTDGTHTIEVQESDAPGSGFAAVDDSRIVGTEPAIVAADDDEVFLLVVAPTKRYVRVVSTVTGSPATGAAIGAVVIGTDPRDTA